MSFVIEKETEGICNCCGKVAEIRPYGKNGANICFSCMMKDEKQAKQIFRMLLEDSDGKILS